MINFLNAHSKRMLAIIMSALVLFVCTTNSAFGITTINRIDFKTTMVSESIPFLTTSWEWDAPDKSGYEPAADLEIIAFTNVEDSLDHSKYVYNNTMGEWVDPASGFTDPLPVAPTDYLDCKYVIYAFQGTFDRSLIELSGSTILTLDGTPLSEITDVATFFKTIPNLGHQKDSRTFTVFKMITVEEFKEMAAAFSGSSDSSDSSTSAATASPATGDDSNWLCLGLSLIVSLGAFGLVLRRQESER